jgi:polysaccharide deacetylase 2 family uncharacterized protein YibQ
VPAGQLFVGGVAIVFLALAAWLAIAKDPFGGEPYAIASIERAKAPEPPVAPPADPVPTIARPEAPTTSDRATAAEVELQSGVKVVRGTGEVAQGLVIRVPQPGGKLAPAPDKRLVERSRHGILPRIGSDGARPAEVYARPAPAVAGKSVRIALVVGGMGLSQSTTSDAIARLPADVTLAFAPYGTELERQVARAREEGHEVMLQVPMEPFDYPDNDPGPHTLTTKAQPSEVMDRLQWVMSRFPGYVGVVNYMGGKFTSSETALAPVLRDWASRGLVALDDGTSPRSQLGAVATGLKLPAARADTTVDAVPKAAAIDDQLARLETIAREKGTAIGVATALPVTLDRIAAWAKGLEAKGIRLVPLTAVIAKPGRG